MIGNMILLKIEVGLSKIFEPGVYYTRFLMVLV
jgi:hypothetical protein